MKIAKYSILLIFSFLVACSSSYDKAVMNTDWGFHLGDLTEGVGADTPDSLFEAIEIPHIMRLEPKHCGGNTTYQGVGWYRRYFDLDKSQKGKEVLISFEGVMINCEVFVNGEKVTEHHGGYMGFVCNVSDYVDWENTNQLAVRVSAEHDPITPPGKEQSGMDFLYYSGIYRDVTLEYRNKLHFTDPIEADEVAGGGIFVTYPEIGKERALVNVKAQLANDGEEVQCVVTNELSDAVGNVVAKSETVVLAKKGRQNIEEVLEVKNPRLWHPYHPDLYTLTSTVKVNGNVVDREVQNIGIRHILQTADGFFINGEKLYLRGTNRHQVFPNVGDAVSNSMHERDVLLIKRGGYNAVRAAHYTHDPAFLDACDKYGLLVIECVPGWQHWTDDPLFSQRLFKAAQEMVRRDRNHPSIFLWETMLNETRYPVAVADTIQQIVHAEYPGDQMYTVGDYWGHKEVAEYFEAHYKQVDNFPPDGDVMTNVPEDMVTRTALYSREWGDGAGEKPRVSLAEDEYEQFRQCRSRLECLDGRGYFDWCMLDANPKMAGHFSWCFMDFPRGLSFTTEYCGAVDLNRYPKFSYYMHQSMRDPRISQSGLYEGPMVHIASYNRSAEFDSSSKNIWVFSNCDSVKLYRNDEVVGCISREEAAKAYSFVVEKGGSPAFIFPVDGYEVGSLKADAYLDGEIVATHSVATPKSAVRLRISSQIDDIKPIADGSDMVPVWVEVVDADGTRICDSEAKIHIEVSGDGKLVGENNPFACIEDQYVEGGVGFFFVRTSSRVGKVYVKVTSEGLETASFEFETTESSYPIVAPSKHAPFSAKPEHNQNVNLQPLSARLYPMKIAKVTTSEKSVYPIENITDGDDNTWWVSSSDKFPQSITLGLKWEENVTMARIRFQKDSSTYLHRVETSRDGKTWTELFTKECTGWDIKPFKVGREICYFRVTFLDVSEGNPGVAEISLYE